MKKTETTLKPGKAGTKRLLGRYGDRLVCVRYRIDTVRRRRYKTVELIVDEGPWTPPGRYRPNDFVDVRLKYSETNLRRQVKEAGGFWLPDVKLWRLRYSQASALGLFHRIVRKGSQKKESPTPGTPT